MIDSSVGEPRLSAFLCTVCGGLANSVVTSMLYCSGVEGNWFCNSKEQDRKTARPIVFITRYVAPL